METINKSAIYWKWNDILCDSDSTEKIVDLCRRTDIRTVFIGLHWIRHRFSDKRLLEALALCSRELHKRGRRMVVEACVRNEGAAFFEQYPGDVAYCTTATDILLDKKGEGEAIIDTTRISHYWRTIDFIKPNLLTAFIIDKSGEHQFKRDSWQRADEAVTLEPKSDYSTIVRVKTGVNFAGKTVVAFVGIPQPIPDLASIHLMEFYNSILNHLHGIDIDGVMSDEWGYDVIIHVNEQVSKPDVNKRPELYFEHVTYSDGFARRYADNCFGNLLEDLLYFYYTEEGSREKSIGKVNAYHKTFRDIMRRNDEDMYVLAKQKLGKDTFYGVHPTWWGNNYLQNFEGFKNGFYWWEAKRDIAQTDEIVIMPIRTALAHLIDIFVIWYLPVKLKMAV